MNDYRALSRVSGVYALVDPRDDRIMYIGQSVDIGTRLKQHLNPKSNVTNWPLHGWIMSLIREGTEPLCRVLVRCEQPEMDAVEIQAIREHRAAGDCIFNVAKGGAGAVVSRVANTTRDEWAELGRRTRDLLELSHEVQTLAFRLSGTKTERQLGRVVASIEKARSTLENVMIAAHPTWGREAMGYFYGRRSED